MKLDNLTPEQQQQALTHFRNAVAARIKQWDEEREIEKLFGEDAEIDIDIAEWAGIDNADDLTLEDLRAALGN